MSINPGLVAGPIRCKKHDMSFQGSMKRMLMFEPVVSRQMNIADVCNIAQAHRLCVESTVAGNGSRYIIAAADESGILYTPQLQEKMKALFPQFENIGGEGARKLNNNERAFSSLAMGELGLKPYSIDETSKATGDSFVGLGLLPGS